MFSNSLFMFSVAWTNAFPTPEGNISARSVLPITQYLNPNSYRIACFQLHWCLIMSKSKFILTPKSRDEVTAVSPPQVAASPAPPPPRKLGLLAALWHSHLMAPGCLLLRGGEPPDKLRSKSLFLRGSGGCGIFGQQGSRIWGPLLQILES